MERARNRTINKQLFSFICLTKRIRNNNNNNKSSHSIPVSQPFCRQAFEKTLTQKLEMCSFKLPVSSNELNTDKLTLLSVRFSVNRGVVVVYFYNFGWLQTPTIVYTMAMIRQKWGVYGVMLMVMVAIMKYKKFLI